MSDNYGEQIMGPVIELAAKVKAALERESTDVKVSWGNFYVSSVELSYYDGGTGEVVGYLTPDDGEGNTFDFYSPVHTPPEA